MAIAVPPDLAAVWFDIDSEDDVEALVRRRARPRRDTAIVCAACGGRVTSRGARIRVAGAHEHAFANPHGMRFHIGCFAEAHGAETHEPGTEAWTWFAGFEWHLATCRGCRAHLGWAFRAVATPGDAPARFFGLILDRLREAAG